MAITQIKIYKRTSLLWTIYDNTQPSENIQDNRISSNYAAESTGDFVTIKTKTGGILYEKKHFSIFRYIDTIDNSNNFTPTSAGDLIAKLKLRGFFGTEEGGSGGVFLFKELSDTFSSFAGLNGHFLMINEVTNKIEPYNLAPFDQNNIGLYLFFGELPGTGVITAQEVANFINGILSAVNVTAKITPVIFEFTRSGVRYLYYFLGGKGKWGAVATTFSPLTVYPYQLKLAAVFDTVTEDIENYPGATIIPLGTLTNGDYLTAANTADRDFSDAGTIEESGNVLTYFFSYTTNNVLYFVQFVGEPAVYTGNLTADDLVATTNSTVSTPVNEPAGIKVLINDNTPSPTITGTTGNTIMVSKLIPAGTIENGDYGELVTLFKKNNISQSSVSYRYYLGTTGTAAGDTQIAFTQGETNQVVTDMSRPLYFKTNSVETVNFTSYAKNVLNNGNASSEYQALTVDWGVDQYLSIAIKLDNAADSARLINIILRINKQRLEI